MLILQSFIAHSIDGAGWIQRKFGVHSLNGRHDELTAAVYLQVSIISQALIFVTRSMSWSFLERPGVLLMSAFWIAQLVRDLLPVKHKTYLVSRSNHDHSELPCQIVTFCNICRSH